MAISLPIWLWIVLGLMMLIGAGSAGLVFFLAWVTNGISREIVQTVTDFGRRR